MNASFEDLTLIILLFICGCNSPEKENPIIEENKQEGTTDWLLTHVPIDTCRITEPWTETTFCRTKQMEAYCSHTSLYAGQLLEVFASTDPISTFNVDIYRLGYYQGKGGRLMTSLGPFQGTTQPTPPDGEKNVRECNWEKSFDFQIPSDWVSGVYLGKLTAEVGGWQSYVIFVVKDQRHSDFLFQCSDFTWQAYNRWPAWRSLYDWEADWGYTPWYTRPGPEGSFDRPYTFYMNSLPATLLPHINGSGEFLLWEFPLAFWMEQQGYDVSYISNLDTHEDREGLLRTKGFLSVGHDEYWTRQMYENVSNARDEGINLLFLSGNSLSGEIYLKAASNGASHRILGRKKFFQDEQWLMGARSYGVGLADWTCTQPNHWMFEGTNMEKGDGITDLVGWEYHGYPLPDIDELEVVAEGALEGAEDTSRYAATYYEGPKGNFVFNAATCWWSMLLSTPPGFPYPQNPRELFIGHSIDFRQNDERVQTITRNLLDQAIQN